MQLVAYGAQDIYLSGNPQITFWKVVYRRHTNFARESIQQTWNGTTLSDGRCSATISRNGDLLSRMYLEVAGNPGDTDTNNPGCAFIKSLEVQIGGQQIDKHTGKWMETWAELTQPNSAALTSNTVAAGSVGNGTLFQEMSGMGGVASINGASQYHVPLQFWFCRNPGLALPLIALQYHEVKVIMEHSFGTIFNSAATTNNLWCEYIYLDTDERRRFAQVSHEYLIEQVQIQDFSTASSQDLTLNHPVKELVWTASEGASGAVDGCSLVPSVGTNAAKTLQLKLNGHDRFAARKYCYFSRVQVHEHHTGCGGLDSDGTEGVGNLNDAICVYSFALEPEEHQPSGTCNFSRIDTAQLVLSTGSFEANTTLFAVNYNVLRIMSGMGGLAYSN